MRAPRRLVGQLVVPHPVVGSAEHVVEDVEADARRRLHVTRVDRARKRGMRYVNEFASPEGGTGEQ